MIRLFIYRIKSYINWRRSTTPLSEIHTPFVKDFVTDVIQNNTSLPKLEQIRNRLKRNHTKIEVLDLGAGSTKGAQHHRRISSIARNALKNRKNASFLYRLVKKYKPKSVVELGTSLGLTTLYLQEALPTPVKSIEGSPEIYRIASAVFDEYDGIRPEQHLGNFDDVLPSILGKLSSPYLIYIDGNHTYDATIRYFDWIMENIGDQVIIIFDDIYWSPGMTEAWEKIIADPRIDLSLDLYQFGIVFISWNMSEKENYKLLY